MIKSKELKTKISHTDSLILFQIKLPYVVRWLLSQCAVHQVQTEFNEYGHEVHAKCCELRTALDTRESLLMSSLERMRKVKEKSLNSDSVHCCAHTAVPILL